MSLPALPWSASRPLALGLLTLLLLCGGLGSWSVFTTLAGAVIAPGQIEVSQSRQIVQHLDGGVVEAILVQEGSAVQQGEVVLRLDGSVLRSDQAIITTQLLEVIARRARLEAQRDGATVYSVPDALSVAATARPDVAEIIAGQASLLARQADALVQATQQRETRIGQIESQMQGLQAQEAAVRTEITLLEAERVTLSDLEERGLTPATRVSELDRELARLQGRLGEVTFARAEAAGRITESRIEISALLAASRERAEADLRDVAARQLELAERSKALAERIDRLDVRAPASGLVLGLKVTTPQSVVVPAEALMFIVPQDRPLLVAARLPVTHVEEVHPGQPVRLVFGALSTRNAPQITGTVTLVSADAIADERSGVAYFRCEIAIDAATLQTLIGVEIVPGMPVDAFIRTGDRTPLSYLLKPFADYFRAAFRET